MKLTIEMVPKSCLMQNVHYQMQTAQWNRLCLKVFRYQAKYRCGMCGQKRETLHCQEMWEYNDLARTRRLTGFLALCPLCYYGKNIDEARVKAVRGELSLRDVVNHFCRINACTTAVFEVHEKEARRLWKQRNRQKKWQSDLGEYAYLLTHPSSPEKIPVRRARKKPLAYGAYAAKRKEALQEKSLSQTQKADCQKYHKFATSDA